MQPRPRFALHGNPRVKGPHVQFSFSLDMKIGTLIIFRVLISILLCQDSIHGAYLIWATMFSRFI